MIDPHQETAAAASILVRDRLRALKRIIPRAQVEEVLAQTGHDRAMCKRLPAWFTVWFMIALGLCCRDSYRQIFRWLQPYRPNSVPGRSTLCEARKRLGIGPLRVLADQVIRLLGRPETPQVLARVPGNRVFKPIEVLEDGSYLSKIYPSDTDRRRDRNGIVVRIIEYTLNDPNRPGAAECHRLLTTLLDPELDPAKTLVCLYHERWEHELALDELETHLRERPVLRSQTPAGAVQEVYALMLAHFLVRVLMQDAAATQNLDPQRISFTAAVKILRTRPHPSARVPGQPARRPALVSAAGSGGCRGSHRATP